jgi:hypothetical protein
MESLLPYFPWIVGLVLVLAVVRFVVGMVLRLVGIAVVLLLAWTMWRALSGS